MFQSLRLGKFFGIDLYIHGTFWLLPLIVLMSGLIAGSSAQAVTGELVFLFAVFGCVVLHEVGHALAARSYGIGTRDITLYPIGGVASLESIPEKPSREIAIALAGPAVNLVIAVALLMGPVGGELINPWAATAVDDSGLNLLAVKVFWANVILACFNLLPAFPMDGGRVLRAVLATRMNRVRATATAVGVGSVVAGIFLVTGILTGHFGLIAVAIVVYLLGKIELAGVRFRAAHQEWNERIEDWAAPPTERNTERNAAGVSDGFTGLMWDASHRAWVQYQNGQIVRVINSSQ